MSLEGRLRELALPEVLQLLGLSRKSGRLELRAQLQGRAAFICLASGAVVDAGQWRVDDAQGDQRTALETPHATRVQACVLDLLTWRDGEFRFVPDDEPRMGSSVRLSVDMLLVEAAQHAERWERVAGRIAHAHVVPAYVDMEPQQLPLLRLVPQEWEILTRVDGRRDLAELAEVLGRDVVDVADIVHGLMESGLLTLREAEIVPRRHATPPTGAVMQVESEWRASPSFAATTSESRHAGPPRDLWVPSDDDIADHEADGGDDDTIFDPIALGVQTPDGMPRRRTAPRAMSAIGSVTVRVAPTVTDESLARGEAHWPTPGMDASTLCSHGDDAARRGDLAGALSLWSAALRSELAPADADRIREAIALAARLHALLHPAARSA
jgi:hypothetical protein